MKTRIEHDTMGQVEVPTDRYWGAQTARSLANFRIGDERMPRKIIRALGILKLAAARTNSNLGLLPEATGELIGRASQEVIASTKRSSAHLTEYFSCSAIDAAQSQNRGNR